MVVFEFYTHIILYSSLYSETIFTWNYSFCGIKLIYVLNYGSAAALLLNNWLQRWGVSVPTAFIRKLKYEEFCKLKNKGSVP